MPIQIVNATRSQARAEAREVWSELDSHADTCVVGNNALVFQDFGRPVDVIGYDKELGVAENCRTVGAAVAYDDPGTGQTIILVINQATYMPQLETNLLNPMQLRMSGVKVSEEAKFLAESPSEETHALVVPDETGTESYLIPLALHGVISYFPTYKPTKEQFESLPRFYLTQEQPEWNPSDTSFAEQEKSMTNSSGEMLETGDSQDRLHSLMSVKVSRIHSISVAHSIENSVLREVSNTLDDKAFLEDMSSRVQISSVSSSAKKPKIDPSTLARKWGIGLDVAQNTIRKTTQRGVRTVLHPTLSRRFRINDRQLRYKRLRSNMFSDTLISSITSKDGNKYAQVFCTDYGWTRAFPMKRKSEAHEALSLYLAVRVYHQSS